jgi:anti-sigma-K factor RskA
MDVSPHRDEHLDLCAGHALGSLTEAEARTLEEHLKEGCSTCEAELNRMGRGVWAFAAATPRLLEPSSLRGRVLSAVRSESGRGGAAPVPRVVSLPRRRAAARVLGWTSAAAAVLIAAFALYEWRAADALRRELEVARQEVARLDEQIRTERQWSAVATAPQSRVIDLAATPAGSPGLHARVSFDPGTRRALVVVSDFRAPAGKDYQLWAITKNGPASLGLVRADESGRATLRLENAADPFTLSAFAVSLEQEGGSPTPTAPAGPVVLIGKVGT